MTEAELQHAAEQALAGTGLLWHHCGRPEFCRGPKGFPDLFILGWQSALAAELKSGDGRRSRGQIQWARRAESAGLSYLLARPDDLPALTARLEGMT